MVTDGTDLRIPPQYLDSEKYVVAAAIVFREARDTVAELVTPEQFYSDIYAGLLRLVQRLKDDGQLSNPDETVNFNTILTAINDSRICNQMTGGINTFLADLLYLPCQTYLRYHAGRIVSTAIQRTTINRLEEATRAAWDGESADVIASRMIETAELIQQRLKPTLFRTMTSAELDGANLSTEYLVSDVLARMQSTIIAAAKKSLKTNIAIDLTLSLASRCYFLGKFHIPTAVRVGLMSGESGDATIQETARRIARSKLWPNLSDYGNAVWSFDLPRLGHPQTKRELIQFIRDNGLEVLIIDPAYLCLDLGDDAGNLFSVGKKLRELTDIQHETGCTIVIIHHNTKSRGDAFAVPELESIAWSGFQEWARQWILIGRREAYNPEQAGSHRMWLSVGGSAGHSGLWGVDIEEGSRTDPDGRRWEVSIDGASKVIAENITEREQSKEQQAQAKAERQLEADAAKLLAEYRKRPDGDTEKYFRERAHLSGARAGAANEKLLADGKIIPCEVIKNGRKWDAFKASGLIGTDRDSIGTENPVPMGAQSGTTAPIGGSPDPAHRDSENLLFVNHGDSSPDGMPEWESRA